MTTKKSSLKQKCFFLVENHLDNCLLYIYGKDIRLVDDGDDILTCLREMRFGDAFRLIYFDSRNVRHSVNVLVDTYKWLRVSECMVALIYSYKNRQS